MLCPAGCISDLGLVLTLLGVLQFDAFLASVLPFTCCCCLCEHAEDTFHIMVPSACSMLLSSSPDVAAEQSLV